MNARALILTAVAIVLAGITIFLARGWLIANQQQAQQSVVEQPRGPKILVAKNNLVIGHIVEPEDLEWVSWHDEDVNASYIKEGAGNPQDFSGDVVRHGLLAGEPITRARVVKPGERGFMAAILAPGMRAVSIPVDRTSGVAGFIFPGDRVDIILTHQVADSEIPDLTHDISETIVQNVRVLGVDEQTSDQANTPIVAKTVTVEVTPHLAEVITVARRFGSMSLSLRSITMPDGVETIEIARDTSMPSMANYSQTWGADVSPTMTPPSGLGQSQTMTVNVRRADRDQEIKFKDSGSDVEDEDDGNGGNL